MSKFARFSARAVVLNVDNVDTDQIIPARYLTTTTRTRLSDALFADWRSDPSFALNQPDAHGAEILLAGSNFGCGSSREHAVWALQSGGFQAVISPAFADIFRNNALGNGFLPIELPADVCAYLQRLCTGNPATTLTVDLEAQTVATEVGDSFPFPVDSFARHCLLNGVDALGYLLAAEAEITQYEAAHAR